MHQWNTYTDFNQASQAAADFLAERIDAFLKENGVCHVILPGGNTPVTCLNLLAKKSLSWDKVHWYLGDERCLPQGDPERNDLMLDLNLWSAMDKTYIHRIPAELGADEAAAQYRNEIKAINAFDIAFLGIGDDGHTASLFPGHEALNDHRSVIPVYHSPKPPSDRVSLSLDTLHKTKTKIVLVAGREKAHTIKKIKEGAAFPINCIGDINWFIDQESNTAEI
ncbi:MAG: 6-phosphogluconolactonase [Gammaproteobacteria bacterium]|nr:6-phosphogluconolactonase [Gammaproteobacteria bacterium]